MLVFGKDDKETPIHLFLSFCLPFTSFRNTNIFYQPIFMNVIDFELSLNKLLLFIRLRYVVIY
jgi:hypothetical protein